MSITLPTVKQIDKARTPLRQACELALQIEALDGYAPDERTEQYRRQFINNLEWAALRLGFELKPVGPVLIIDNTREA